MLEITDKCFKSVIVTDGYGTLTLNGKEIELYRQSYFVMKDEIETIEFMGMKIKLTKVK